MRILGFSKKWDKLEQDEFTTFRFPRRDKDWYIGEKVQVKIKPRQKGGGVFVGIALIIDKRLRRIDRFRGVATIPYMGFLTEEEVVRDGFQNAKDMLDWLQKSYGNDDRWVFSEPMNKLTLRWFSH